MPLALVAAFAGSLFLHVAALFGTEIELPSLPEPAPLQAELRMPPPPPAEAPKPVKPAPEHKPRSTAKPAVHHGPSAMPAPAAPATTPSPAAAPAPEAKPAAEPPAPPAPPAQAPQPIQAASGTIRYLVYRGNQGFQVGRSSHSWEFADGNYRITSVTETSGLAALFKPVKMELESRGKLTAQGLQPEHFVTRRNGKDTDENADFDWAAGQVKLQREGSPRLVEPGCQDLLSFHYQLAYLPRLAEGVAFAVTTGKKLDRYRFDALGEEVLDIPAGHFRTLHVRVQTDSTTELWLALDRQMLPVKIRFTDRKGESFEQVANEMGTP